jgi:outer membrane cobalamin receptor
MHFSFRIFQMTFKITACASACAFAIAITIVFASGAHAEESATSSDIIVTATRSERPLNEVPASVSVIGSAQIAATPAKALDDILRRVPSVDLPSSASDEIHPTAATISMRGLGGIRALVLLGGVPLNDPFFGTIQWGRVPLEAIDRVEVVRGGGATLWGNYAMGGVINIISRDPAKSTLVVQGSGGSLGTIRASANGALVLSDAVTFTLDAQTNHSDGYNETLPAERGPITRANAFNAYNVSLGGAFKLGANTTAHARASFHADDQRYQTELGFNKQHNWTYAGDISQSFGTAALTASVFHGNGRFQTDNTGTPAGFASNAAEFIQNRHVTPVHDSGTSLIWSQTLTGVLRSYAIGVDAHFLSGQDSAQIFDETNIQIRTDIGRGKQRFLGGFVQASLRPVESLEILASARVQSFLNYAAFDGNPGGLGNLPSQRASSFNPRVSVRYAISKAFALRAAGYTAFRAPTLDNLYRSVSVPTGIFYSNAALTPETMKGGEFGVDYTDGGLRAQVTFYSSRIDNLLTFRNLETSKLPPGFAFGARNINAGSARSRGVEAELNWTISKAWALNAGYTYADSIITNNVLDPASVGLQQAYVPTHKLSGALTYTGPHGLSITPQIRYYSASFGDNAHTLPIDAQVVVDLSASYAVSPRLGAFVQVQNLLDNRFVADNNGFEPRRLSRPLTATLGVRVKLD